MASVIRGNDNFDSAKPFAPLSSTSVSGTPTTIDISLPSGYHYYILDIQNVRPTANAELNFRIMNGSTLLNASSYAYNIYYNAPDGSNQWNSQSSNYARITTAQDVGASYSEGASARLTFGNTDGANYPQGSYESGVHRDYYGGGRIHTMWTQTAWAYRVSTAYNKVRLFWSSGTTFQNQGTVKLYGVAE